MKTTLDFVTCVKCGAGSGSGSASNQTGGSRLGSGSASKVSDPQHCFKHSFEVMIRLQRWAKFRVPDNYTKFLIIWADF